MTNTFKGLANDIMTGLAKTYEELPNIIAKEHAVLVEYNKRNPDKVCENFNEYRGNEFSFVYFSCGERMVKLLTLGDDFIEDLMKKSNTKTLKQLDTVLYNSMLDIYNQLGGSCSMANALCDDLWGFSL